jgi:hypothetical protein
VKAFGNPLLSSHYSQVFLDPKVQRDSGVLKSGVTIVFETVGLLACR